MIPVGTSTFHRNVRAVSIVRNDDDTLSVSDIVETWSPHYLADMVRRAAAPIVRYVMLPDAYRCHEYGRADVLLLRDPTAD